MPLIAGNKYSCEPCIRGHRATHCNHTDRILIEVRKPGRPLDRCAHAISTCSCAKHLKNSTVVEVKVKERSASPASKQGSKVESANEFKTLMISKEMPFARELRLSLSTANGAGSSVTSSSSSSEEEEGEDDDEDEDVKTVQVRRRSSKAVSVTSSSIAGDRRKGKVFKRHRLSKTDAPSPLFTTSPMDVDVETPALSPSVSESGSERSLPAYFERVITPVAIEQQQQQQPVALVPKVPAVVFRSISISELLT